MLRTRDGWLIGAGLLAVAAVILWGFESDRARPTDSLQASAPQGQWNDGERSVDAASGHGAPAIDRSGGKRFGKASFYADFFAGRKMADGGIMDPNTNNAASRTLPLGTTAKVTNLETGKSAVVTIEDRGPYAAGRIVDLSPATAQKIGISRREGIAKVEVAPIAVPLPDGHIKLGAAATDPQSASSGARAGG